MVPVIQLISGGKGVGGWGYIYPKVVFDSFPKKKRQSIYTESDVNIRALYHCIADGTVCTELWYRDLNQPNKVLNVSKFVEDRTTTLTIFNASTRINPLDNTSGEDNSCLENDQAC